MITNNNLRTLLGLPSIEEEYEILKVDSLRPQKNTLMFINKSDISLSLYDNNCEGCTFLIDDSYPEFSSSTNDFIRVANPKYKFCLAVDAFELMSAFQLEHREFAIGRGCHVDQGAIVGGTDFSPVLADDGSLVQFPQMGGVCIGSNVLIKYNSMIGKGTFGYTKIGDNTMIDYGCQVGHNCIVGKSCIIAAGTIIGGSTVIGDHVTIGIGAKIRNGLKIGNNVSIGMGAVVIKDIPDNSVVVGNPARTINHKPIFDERGLV